MFKEFKEFLSRGNVVDLAVAVVIGTAFTAVIAAIVKGLLTPLIAMAGDRNYDELEFTLRGSTFEYGTVISAVMEFLLVAAAVFFFVVKPMNVLAERRRRGEVTEEEIAEDVLLLTEIRDLLRERRETP